MNRPPQTFQEFKSRCSDQQLKDCKLVLSVVRDKPGITKAELIDQVQILDYSVTSSRVLNMVLLLKSLKCVMLQIQAGRDCNSIFMLNNGFELLTFEKGS